MAPATRLFRSPSVSEVCRYWLFTAPRPRVFVQAGIPAAEEACGRRLSQHLFTNASRLKYASVGSLTRVNWTDGGPSEVVGSFETPPTHRRVRLDRAADDASKPGSELEVVQDPEVIRPPSWGSRRRGVVGRHQS
ncbi:hypothetical protein CSIM01_11627 [Colletotrichum simmondsii]|uniref:Uncharacterized protein n=1 Tax=Colletotrichum simmondsii TaxID=703756 RepID=A0A135SU35_9PEZI|nr:hypothetical protein CSIM01_11627 [Colletotrichum simmondsii]